MNTLPVLALPGLLNDERLWHHQARAFAGSHPFTVVASTGHDSVDALARQALARAPQGRFALVGFSLGGYVALELMRQAPDRIAALALVDTGPRPDAPQATEFRLAAIAEARRSGRLDGSAAAMLARLLHPSHLGDTALTELMTSMGEAVGVEGFVLQQTAAMNRPDSRPTLATVRCPTTIVCGRQDQTTPLELSEEMAAGIAGATLVVVEQSGHMSPLEQPDAVTAALRAAFAAA